MKVSTTGLRRGPLRLYRFWPLSWGNIQRIWKSYDNSSTWIKATAYFGQDFPYYIIYWLGLTSAEVALNLPLHSFKNTHQPSPAPSLTRSKVPLFVWWMGAPKWPPGANGCKSVQTQSAILFGWSMNFELQSQMDPYGVAWTFWIKIFSSVSSTWMRSSWAQATAFLVRKHLRQWYKL